MYHRLFKDSKVKHIKETEFYEFLKLKQSKNVTDIISAKFSSPAKDLENEQVLNTKLIVQGQKSR